MKKGEVKAYVTIGILLIVILAMLGSALYYVMGR